MRRGEHGQASIELVGLLALLLVAGLAVWQVLLAGWAATSAANAARTGSRVESRGGGGGSAARESLSSALRDEARVQVAGETTTVTVRVPILLPGLLSRDDVTITKRATVPRTAGGIL
jgi:hypothetical protein